MAQRISSIKEHTGKRETKERTTSANPVVFPRVKTLILDELPKFTGSSSSRDGVRGVKWLELDTVEVSSCPNIGKSMLGKVDRSLLKKVTVKNCQPWALEDLESNIGHLFELTDEISKLENLRIDDSKELQKYMKMELHDSSFRQLKTVEAFHCDNELNKFLSILLRRSSKLERLTVERCDLLEQVFDLTGIAAEEGNLKFPNLQTMRLFSLPNLKCIWNRGPLSIVLLEKLVLPKELNIESCKTLEHVVQDNEERQERSFHSLEDLSLADLPELTKFSSANCNVRFPNLLRLTIKRCPKLTEFTTELLSNQKPTIEGTSSGVPQKEMMHACPKLERLMLEGPELSSLEVVSLGKLSYMRIAGSNKLNKLVVRNCSSLGRLELPTKCVNLKDVEISDCNILEQIATDRVEGGKRDEKTSSPLESIVLENLPKLSFSSSETPEFPSLKKLRIINCPEVGTSSGSISRKAAADHSLDKRSLARVLFDDVKEEGKMKMLELLELANLPNKQLWKQEPKFPVFQSLADLKIMRCGIMEKLFSIPVAEHLSRLRLLSLYECENMVQVLGGGGANSKRVFQKLETLVLKHMPTLTSFCEDDVDFGELPELKMVRVEDVPKMSTFVKQPLRTPKLKQVYVTHIKKCWLQNLNETIEHLHRNHDKLRREVWKTGIARLIETDSLKCYADEAEKSSSQGKFGIKEAEAEMELHEGVHRKSYEENKKEIEEER
ncbi:uncharacterized protein LOC114722605 [Neltuma alba]|uniref:uncharacterized protein LOC114722605 n=1 Tax=Neltuma alba TaxID=207710 RepID=UPI0010A485E2|nr:uncharacterized protein LOC114722605 [Prosopis alba]